MGIRSSHRRMNSSLDRGIIDDFQNHSQCLNDNILNQLSRQESIYDIHQTSVLDNTILSNRSHYQGQTLVENILHEFQEQPKLITRQEKKIEWNKIFIVNLFEELATKLPYKLSYNDRDAGNIYFEICEKGTPYYSKIPLFKTEYIYPSKYNMEQLVEAF